MINKEKIAENIEKPKFTFHLKFSFLKKIFSENENNLKNPNFFLVLF